MAVEADFHVINGGSIVTFRPLTEAAAAWWQECVDDGPCLGGSFAVEHRYAGAIIEGLEDEGFELGEAA